MQQMQQGHEKAVAEISSGEGGSAAMQAALAACLPPAAATALTAGLSLEHMTDVAELDAMLR